MVNLDLLAEQTFRAPQDVPPCAHDMYGNELYRGDEVVEWEPGKYLLEEDFFDTLKECGFKKVSEMLGLQVIEL